MSDSNTDVISGLYAAFGRGDIPAILQLLDADVAWHAPLTLPHGGEFSGRDGVAGFFEGLGATWDGLGLDLQDLVSSGDRVVALARIDGTLRATGEQTGYSSAHCWTLRDGAIVRFDEYVDTPLSMPGARPVSV